MSTPLLLGMRRAHSPQASASQVNERSQLNDRFYTILHFNPSLIHHNMTESYNNIKERIKDAREHYATCEKLNIAKIARDFNVPEQRLRRCIAGNPSKSERTPTNTYLFTAGELTFIQYTKRLDRMYLSVNFPGLAAAAFAIRKIKKCESRPRFGYVRRDIYC
jgi:hypothetical protein